MKRLAAGPTGIPRRTVPTRASFSDKRPGPDVVATTIPIEGTVRGPQVPGVPTIMGALRKPFVRGLSESISGLPPPKAKKPQGSSSRRGGPSPPGKGSRGPSRGSGVSGERDGPPPARSARAPRDPRARLAARKPREPVRPDPVAPETHATPQERGVPPSGERPRVPASPKALLAPSAVGELQRALLERGLLGAHRPGDLDRATSAAVRRFQREEDLPDTGMPDRETLRRLGIDPEKAYRSDRL